jgi:hypothetical protein
MANESNEKGILQYVAVAILYIASILSGFLPAPVWLIANVLIFALALRHWRRMRILFALTVLVFSIKALGSGVLFYEITKPYSSITSREQYYAKYFPLSVFSEFDFGQLELELQSRVRKVNKSGQLVDPFTGEPFREADGLIYSVGPDQMDHRGRIIYDPSNGILSRGDIIRKHLPTPISPQPNP